MYETIISAKQPAPQFAPVALTRFAPEMSLSVQHTPQGSIIAAYNKASAKLEIYDPEVIFRPFYEICVLTCIAAWEVCSVCLSITKRNCDLSFHLEADFRGWFYCRW